VPIIPIVRHGASTVVVLAGLDLLSGPDREDLLAALGRATNVSVVRAAAGDDPLRTAAAALREASRRSSSYALVPDDPLAAVAAEWQAMWDVSGAGAGGGQGFELRAAEALSSWRAGGFELPDYYLVLAPGPGGTEAAAAPHVRAGQMTGRAAAGASRDGPSPAAPAAQFHLGPLRTARPHRVAVVASPGVAGGAAGTGPGGAGRAAEVLRALGSLEHGPWWPPLDEVIDAARSYYPGAVSPEIAAAAAPTRRPGAAESG